MKRSILSIDDISHLPKWRRPFTLLVLMSVAMSLGFSTWVALLNNFVHERAGFDGSDIGWLHSIREVPGFLAIGVIVVLWVLREQVLANASLIMLGGAVAVTAWFPTFGGIMLTTLISSIGFHYFETVKASLELQWLPKDNAPVLLGWLMAAGSCGSLVTYSFIMVTWKLFDLDYNTLYLTGGGITVAIGIFCWVAYPEYRGRTVQNKSMVLRKRYWLYYVLQFMAGARRQIFMVFAAYMMVERFGFEVHEVTALFLINYLANMIFAPLMGGVVKRFGERNALVFEYTGLTLLFCAYGGIYVFGWGVVFAASLYVIDHFFFALSIALKTYLQKIADPADIAPTAAVAFTINHIGAVLLPALLGYIWLVSPASVFGVAAGIAVISLCLSLLIPRNPREGAETIFKNAQS